MNALPLILFIHAIIRSLLERFSSSVPVSLDSVLLQRFVFPIGAYIIGGKNQTRDRRVDLVLSSEVLMLAPPRASKFNLLGLSFSKSISKRKVAEQEVMLRKCPRNLSKQRWRFSWNNAGKLTSS